jgi:hypothetical protein
MEYREPFRVSKAMEFSMQAKEARGTHGKNHMERPRRPRAGPVLESLNPPQPEKSGRMRVAAHNVRKRSSRPTGVSFIPARQRCKMLLLGA